MKKFENIFIDESGNTGQDLLNIDQPVFVLATNNFSNDECLELASLFKANTELHFKTLKNSDEGRNSIINFINHDLITEKNIICSVADKMYCTVGQLIDRIIEPVMHTKGIDLYRFGGNIIATNIIYILGNYHWDKGIFNGLLSSFVDMVRTKSPESITKFYSFALQLYENSQEKTILQPIIESRTQIDSILESINKFSIDLTLSAFYVLCDFWFKKTGNTLSIIQDESKQISYFKEYIDFTKQLNMPNQDIGFGNRTMIFPTQIESLELVNSVNYIGVQISDLIASTIAFVYNNRNIKQGYLVEQIKNSKLFHLDNYHTIWPTSYVTPDELGMASGNGQNVLDFLAKKWEHKPI